MVTFTGTLPTLTVLVTVRVIHAKNDLVKHSVNKSERLKKEYLAGYSFVFLLLFKLVVLLALLYKATFPPYWKNFDFLFQPNRLQFLPKWNSGALPLAPFFLPCLSS